MHTNIKINEDRLWNSLNEMALIGATDKGGVNRQALTDLDKASRDLFIKWCKEENLSITIDQMGNIFARREGKNNNLRLLPFTVTINFNDFKLILFTLQD